MGAVIALIPYMPSTPNSAAWPGLWNFHHVWYQPLYSLERHD